ncbi:DUF4434 domain-containing protein [Poriferisphaera sp. WC338]|uniref:DUF4434 domain-containing protein n=1 Tax=Poriferisphaera sp. WC338 TaxID=3425129 RepID=UPI003D8177BF
MSALSNKSESCRSVPAKISATFVDLSIKTHRDHTPLDLTYDQWVSELSDMQAAGIGTAIVSRTLVYGRTYHYSKHFETWNEKDTFTPLMQAATDVGMPLFFSGQLNNLFWSLDDANFDRLLVRDLELSKRLFDELLEQYPDAPLEGFYITYEPDRMNAPTEKRMQSLRNFMVGIYHHLKQARPDLPLLTSPFYGLEVPPDELADWWRAFLSEPMCDIVAMQDGVGCARKISPTHVAEYYPALKQVFDEKNITFWNNLETFVMNPAVSKTPCDPKDLWFYSAPISRLEDQYEAAKDYVSRTITWEYGNFLSKRCAGEDIYNAFKAWNLSVTADEKQLEPCVVTS